MNLKNINFPLSKLFIGLNILIYFTIFLLYPNTSFNLQYEALVNFGAKVNFKIADGEYLRLFTSMFLHVNLMHLAFNCFAIHVLGRDIEVIYGKRKYIIIYFVAGLTGSFGSYLLNDAVAAGASGAIFGLLGANLYLYFYNKEVYKKIYGNGMFILLLMNLVFGFYSQNIDIVAHIFGLVGGFIVAYAIQLKRDTLKLKRLTAVCVLFIVIISGSYVRTLQYKKSWKYYYTKSIYVLQNNQLIEGKQLLEQGLKIKETPELINLYNTILEFEKNLQ